MFALIEETEQSGEVDRVLYFLFLKVIDKTHNVRISGLNDEKQCVVPVNPFEY